MTPVEVLLIVTRWAIVAAAVAVTIRYVVPFLLFQYVWTVTSAYYSARSAYQQWRPKNGEEGKG